MRVAGLIIGLIGAIWGMFAGLGGWVVFFSIVGAISAACAMSYPKNAGIIMIIAAVLGWIVGKGGFLWQGIFLLVAGILAISGQKELEE
ncbi:MAG: hypothetical protein GX338_05045 [Firmicutes bacterium]|jgi:hypothetical protein|nr:hypothetical protein [Bacillota bacterium]